MLVRKVSNGMEGADSREAFIPIACMHCGERNTLRGRLPAASRGSGQGYRHRDADAAALPGLPLLHDRLSLSCPLLQLVGSAVAGGHGEKPQSGSCRSHARRRGEVQHVPLTVHSAREKAAAAGRKEIDPADYIPACVEACPTGAILFGNLADENDPVSSAAHSPMRFGCWRGSARSPRFTTNRSKPGCERWRIAIRISPRRPSMAEILLIDRRLIARGVERASTIRFLLWLAPWVFLLLLGIYAAGLCLYYGLNQTHMDNRFAFGMWIFLDLGIIAMGAGAFFTGFLVYILRQEDLKARP